jgi:hypothetical protein
MKNPHKLRLARVGGQKTRKSVGNSKFDFTPSGALHQAEDISTRRIAWLEARYGLTNEHARIIADVLFRESGR